MRNHHRRGAALVEGALVMSLFLLLIVSVVDLAAFLHEQYALLEQTRSALRTGSVKGLTGEEIASMVVFGKEHPPDGASRGFQGLTLENVDVKVLQPGTPDQRVVVTVRGMKRRMITPLLPGSMGNLRLQMSSPLEKP